ncbi:hypothetical protein PR048_013326 [Dryococelus australis]|uniref:YqaJ viral recombinase domain-containing protein n=1 Tax=Dryococelus australis TaxID=614101 RepID=A0ABQ9HS10_9NEOP|nr:hypothetical protein PR048_013326 [Dryococelus australis]
MPFLCEIPDGVISNDGIVEVKCPSFSYRQGMFCDLNTVTNIISLTVTCDKMQLLSVLHMDTYLIDMKVVKIESADNFWEAKMKN